MFILIRYDLFTEWLIAALFYNHITIKIWKMSFIIPVIYKHSKYTEYSKYIVFFGAIKLLRGLTVIWQTLKFILFWHFYSVGLPESLNYRILRKKSIFSITGYVNKQNCQIWSVNNQEVHQAQLHPRNSYFPNLIILYHLILNYLWINISVTQLFFK